MQPDSHSVSNATTIEELLSGLSENGRYDYLRLFLTQHKTNEFGQYYLLVTRSSFRKVKLIDLAYYDNNIYVELEDCLSGTFIHQSFEINDSEFVLILISWNDLKSMVNTERLTSLTDDKLLDLEF
jgi:hypothetical protein